MVERSGRGPCSKACGIWVDWAAAFARACELPLKRVAWVSALGLALCLALAAPTLHAAGAAPAAADPVLDAKVTAIEAELRCLVCQNQTIADSNAELATDLRRQVREMLQQGKTQAQILDYMTSRYGDFVLYRPPVKSTTALLWYGPALLFGAAAVTLWVVLRRRARVGAEAFEADPDSDLGDAGYGPAPGAQASGKANANAHANPNPKTKAIDHSQRATRP
jgi:cytochrome c-type biogenesis protein CcmH